MNKGNIELKILGLLDRECELTFLQLIDPLKEFDKSKKEDAKKLKLLLMEMEDKELIEERHFFDGKVDYSIENAGTEFLKKYKKSTKTLHKWSIPAD